MAGFSEIRRTLKYINYESEDIIFQDLEPISIQYEKFYSDDDMYSFSNLIFQQLRLKLNILKEGLYTLYIDTLGVYMNSTVTYEIKTEITCKAISTILKLDFTELPEYLIEESLF